ncbi:MAG: hypothetical protein ACTSQI_04705 [Candidatus Helarchaeota archaeon]
MELEENKLKLDRFNELWFPLPYNHPKELYNEVEDAYDWVWELIKKVNKNTK